MAKETLTIIKADIKSEVSKKVPMRHLKLGKLEFKATVEVDKSVAKELDTDARFVAKLYDDATKVYKQLVLASALRYQAAENLASVVPLDDTESKELEADIKKLFEQHKKQVEAVTIKHFETWKQANKDRRTYRIKVVGTILVGTTCAVVGTASLAAGTITGGVSIGASIYSIAQSVVAVGKAVQKIVTDITKVHADLHKAMKELVDNYKKASTAKVKAVEIGKEFVEDFLMIQTSGFNRCRSLLATYKAKLKNLDLECAKMGTELNKLLDEQAKLNKKIDSKFEKLLKDRKYYSKTLPELLNNLKKCEKATEGLIKSLEAWHVQLKPAEQFRDGCDKTLAALEKKEPTFAKWVIWIASLGLSTSVSGIATQGASLVSAANGIQTGVTNLVKELT